MSVSYEFYLNNPMGEPVQYGGCTELDVAIIRYKMLSDEYGDDIIVIEHTTTTSSKDITELF